MPKNKPKISCEAQDCPKCKSTNTRLAEIDEKLERLLKLTEEFETYKGRVKSLEDEQKNMQESLGS